MMFQKRINLRKPTGEKARKAPFSLSHFLTFSLSAILLLVASCKKEYKYVYDVNGVTVQQPGGNKNNVKTTTEFISIAYSALYKNTIPTDSLVKIQQAYDSFGDKKLIEDMIIRHFLNSPTISLPTNTQMRADVNKFVDDAILKFFNRKPDAFEKYYIRDIIDKDASLTPAVIYYALMTSDEYRYY